MSTHTLSVLVENKPGVLSHVAGLFSRRAFNISSLAVGPTHDERVSRITIVVDGASTPVEQVKTQLDKLVRVLKVVELHEGTAVERELALIKVRADPARCKPASLARKLASDQAARKAPSSCSHAGTNASGTKRPPNDPNRPRGPGSPIAHGRLVAAASGAPAGATSGTAATAAYCSRSTIACPSLLVF